jgi:hypothetical protein
MSRRSSRSAHLVKYQCENCHHQVDLDLKELRKSQRTQATQEPQEHHEPREDNSVNLINPSSPGLDLPVCVELIYPGFWITRSDGRHDFTTDEQCDRNSVMISTESLLYVYKLALRHYLLSKQLITPADIDAANLVPHVVVRKSKTDLFSYYRKINGEKFIITEDKLSAKADFLLIELDERRDLHMTLIYSKKIGRRVDLMAAFKLVLRTLNQSPQMIQEYRSLDYFGQGEIQYWYENEASFPSAIKTPPDYVPNSIRNEPQHYRLSPAGTIIS